MPSVKCRYYASLQTFLKKQEESFEIQPGTTVEDILDRIIEKYGARAAEHIYSEGFVQGRYYKTASVYVNRKRIQWVQDFPLGLKTVLKDGDALSLGLVMGGGTRAEAYPNPDKPEPKQCPGQLVARSW